MPICGGGRFNLVSYDGKFSIANLETARSQKIIAGIPGGTLAELRDIKEGRNYGRSVLIP